MHPSHALVNEVVFLHILIRCFNWIVHILEGHVQEKWLFGVVGINDLFYSLMRQTKKLALISDKNSNGSGGLYQPKPILTLSDKTFFAV